jgi:hypothetical protein
MTQPETIAMAMIALELRDLPEDVAGDVLEGPGDVPEDVPECVVG